jgi:hypothetical protein
MGKQRTSDVACRANVEYGRQRHQDNRPGDPEWNGAHTDWCFIEEDTG